MKICMVLSVLLLSILTLPSFADNLLHNPPAKTWTGRKTLTWLDAKNEIRYVEVYVPKKFGKSKENIPVVMWFMGSRMNVRKDYHYLGLCYEDSGIEPYAEKNGFMLVVIDQKHEGKGWRILDEEKLDESLVLDVLAYLKRTFRVDESRVYLWGISAGGKLSQVVGSRHSDVFAAVVSFSGVIDELGSDFDRDLTACVKASTRKFPIQHWQTEGDYENLIANMPYMIRLYRSNGHRVEYVFLKNMPNRKLKHEWYADLYNQKMWDWCKQFSLTSSP